MEYPLVSIIIPVYKVEEYLDRCVSSVIKQTYKNIEILLVDDGSPDSSGEMCDTWAKKDSRVITMHKENGGQGSARNMALDLCQGDYILFVDSDDEIDSDMVEKMVCATDKGKVDLVLCGLKINNGLQVRPADWYQCDFIVDNKELMKRYLTDKMIFTGPMCKLFRKSIFEDIRFPNYRANEDAFIMHCLFARCKTASILLARCYTMNLRSDSTEGKSFNPNKLHLIDCAQELRRYIKEFYPEYTRFVENRVINVTMVLVNRLYLDGLEKQYEEIEKQLSIILKEEREYLGKNKFNSYDKTVDIYLDKKLIYLLIMVNKRTKNRIKKFFKNIFIFVRDRR